MAGDESFFHLFVCRNMYVIASDSRQFFLVGSCFDGFACVTILLSL